jgi:hypothetical protein
VPAGKTLNPLDGADPCEAWVEKDGQTLAFILGLVYSGMWGLD